MSRNYYFMQELVLSILSILYILCFIQESVEPSLLTRSQYSLFYLF